MERLDIDKRQQFKAFQFGTINSSVVFSSLSSASFLSGKVEVWERMGLISVRVLEIRHWSSSGPISNTKDNASKHDLA